MQIFFAGIVGFGLFIAFVYFVRKHSPLSDKDTADKTTSTNVESIPDDWGAEESPTERLRRSNEYLQSENVDLKITIDTLKEEISQAVSLRRHCERQFDEYRKQTIDLNAKYKGVVKILSEHGVDEGGKAYYGESEIEHLRKKNAEFASLHASMAKQISILKKELAEYERKP